MTIQNVRDLFYVLFCKYQNYTWYRPYSFSFKLEDNPDELGSIYHMTYNR